MSNTVNRVTIQTALKPKMRSMFREVFEELGLEYNSDNIRRAWRATAHEVAKGCLENGADASEYTYVMTAAVAKEATAESLGEACLLVTGPRLPLPAVSAPEGDVAVEIVEHLDMTHTERIWEGSTRHIPEGNIRIKSDTALFPYVVEVEGRRIIPPGNAMYEAINGLMSRVGGHPFEVTKVIDEHTFDVRFRFSY